MVATPELDTGEQSVAPPARRSIVDTWAEVVADAGGLVRAEAKLARVETERNLRLIGRETAKIIIGGMLGLMALIFLTVSAVVALAMYTGLLLALLIVAIACLGAGALLVVNGLNGVSGQPILPERTLRRMGRDLDTLADKAPLPDRIGVMTGPDEADTKAART